MFKIIVPILSLVFSFSAYARQDCPVGKVEHIQVEHNYAHIKLLDQPWHHIGKLDETGTKERISVLLAAQLAGKNVMIGYSDGYDCTKTNFGTAMIVARTYNN
jgi:hypothetical protein